MSFARSCRGVTTLLGTVSAKNVLYISLTNLGSEVDKYVLLSKMHKAIYNYSTNEPNLKILLLGLTEVSMFFSEMSSINCPSFISVPLKFCLSLQELFPWEGGVHAAGQRGDAHSGCGGGSVWLLPRPNRPRGISRPGPHHVTTLQVNTHQQTWHFVLAFLTAHGLHGQTK